MGKYKMERAYKLLCLGLIGIICIMLTGAGEGELKKEQRGEAVSAMSQSVEYEIEGAENTSLEIINLEDLLKGTYVLRLTYDLNNQEDSSLSIIENFSGEKTLLGKNMGGNINCEISKVELENLFPMLKFQGYSWVDEEKGVGIINLCLTEESKRTVEQKRNTVLYEHLPQSVYNQTNINSIDSVQEVGLVGIYNITIPKSKDLGKAIESQVKILRAIDVIIPESI